MLPHSAADVAETDLPLMLCRANCKQTCNLCHMAPPPPVLTSPAPTTPPSPTPPTLPSSNPSAPSSPPLLTTSSPPTPIVIASVPAAPTDVDNGAVGRPELSLMPSNCTAYLWTTGSWEACNSTCGFGLQTRTVNCLSYGPSLAFGPVADSALCDSAVRPISVISCVTSPCPSDFAAACRLSPSAAPSASGRRLFWW